MSLLNKVVTALAAVVLSGGLALTAGSASATTFKCLYSNGCGSINGVDANGTAVSVDAKYQNPGEMAIGYPDLAGDPATNLALVAHEQRNFAPRTWADTAISGNGSGGGICVATPAPNTCATTDHGSVTTSGAGSVLDVSFTLAIPPAVPAIQPTFSSSLPSGLTATGYTDNAGTWTATVPLGSAAPGVYGGQSVTATYSYTTGIAPAVVSHTVTVTVTFAVTVFAHHQFNPVAATTFYTVVYAKDGVWTSDCLTAVTNGKLRFSPCTLGEDAGQRFYAYANGLGSPAAVAYVTPSGSFAFKNGATQGYLEDPSTSKPSVPQSDAADSVSPGGRQLDVNGSTPSSPFELWTLGS